MSRLFDFFKKTVERKRVVEVGWMIDAEKAGFIYDAPRIYQRNAPKPASTKGVGLCPAVLDYEFAHRRGALSVRCPSAPGPRRQGQHAAAISAAP